MPDRRLFFSLSLLLLLALLLRLGMCAYWERRTEGRFFFGDSQTYWDLGRAIAHGEPYRLGTEKQFAIFRMPGYPVLLAPLWGAARLFGGAEPPILAARLLNVLFGGATVAAVWGLTRRLFPDHPRAAILAAGYVAVAPLQVVASVLVLSEAPFGLCLVWQLDCWVRLLQSQRKSLTHPHPEPPRAYVPEWYGFLFNPAVLLGVATAACVYLRPSWLYFLPFAVGMHALFVLVYGPPAKNDRAAYRLVPAYLLAATVCAACLAPWWVRNYNVSGRFVATTLQVGASLYDGLRPDADGASDMRFVDAFRASVPLDSPTYEYDVDNRMKRAALDWARTHPYRVVELAGIKFSRIWNPWPNEPSFRTPPVRAALALTTVPLLVFSLIGAVRTLRRRSPYCRFAFLLLWLPALYLTLLHMIFVASIRYRTPAELGLAVLAAAVVTGLGMPKTAQKP